MALYLLHFDRPFRHAQHYLGWSCSVAAMHQRINQHYAATPGDGQHHTLIAHARAAGISFTLARVWPNGTRADERKKKQRGHRRQCPICREGAPV